ncbi:SbcC/MukB-like Walker B domain-containing protein [Myroides fluvii]|uniref:SbcC/MukB-like Walker B domain-containing protein n=1 Tax=Myroides fluvii TaxID=2572594 RepID=UPI00131EA308|nr:SbcC/MukB-like Walker B domain-containing protein [Myroides fluvii]
MIPITLTLEGFYSYQEKQVIDFTQLIQAGLFGIFGKVGSGKSSILEAISFGLYGESERLNARDNRAYNMMNLKSDRMSIDFEFFNFKEKKYRIYREFKRNSKRFDDVKRGDAVLYQWKEEQWIPLPDLNVEEVIGLSYENFKRTIIIPQGKFKEFIELGGKDRTKMMQEIFGLDRFDLTGKTKALYSETRQKYDHLQGQLQRFTTLTKEQIDEVKVQHQKQEQQLKQMTLVFKQEQERYQQLKAVKLDFEALEESRTTLRELEQKEGEVKAQELALLQYEKVEKVFRSLLVEKQQTTLKLNEKTANYQVKLGEFQTKQNQYIQVKETFTTLEKQYESLERERTELAELQLVQAIQETEVTKKTLTERLVKGQEVVVATKKELEQKQILLLAGEKQLKQLKENRVDPMRLIALDKWFTDFEYLEKAAGEWADKQKQLQQEIQRLVQTLEQFEFTTEEEWRERIAKQRTVNQQLHLLVTKELNQLRVSQQLSHYASALHDGEACPLCGALEHPAILEGEDVSKSMQDLEMKLEKIQDDEQILNRKEREIQALLDKKHLLEIQDSEAVNHRKEKQEELIRHQAAYCWNEIESGNKAQLEQLKQQAVQVNQAIEKAENQQQQTIKEVDVVRNNLEKYAEALADIELKQARLEAEIDAKEQQIRLIKLSEKIVVKKEILELEIKAKEQHIVEVEQAYKSQAQLLQQLVPILASLETELKNIQTIQEELTASLQHIDLGVKQGLEVFQFESVQEVEVVLAKNIAVEETRASIQAFMLKIEVLRNQVQQLSKKLESIAFDLPHFQQMELTVTALEQQVKEQTTLVAKVAGEIERLEQDYKEKETLLDQFAQVEKRLKNINLLDNMFKGAGFVNYVSSIYLINLCDIANQRFHRLTHNQLSLQLNESNEFEIIDYLNNGKARSVKTLSGGQSFQVSLSLALALAESVQSLSKSNKNFFFIDEGFGTQDAESVNIVFETLSSLHKENRIVGIISHVDELQERIPLSLSIVKDEEKGSRVLTS